VGRQKNWASGIQAPIKSLDPKCKATGDIWDFQWKVVNGQYQHSDWQPYGGRIVVPKDMKDFMMPGAGDGYLTGMPDAELHCPRDLRVAGEHERRPGAAPRRDHGGSAELHRHHPHDRGQRGEGLAVEANGAVVWLSPHGPMGDWRLDIDRPPLGSLTGMLFRA